MTIDDMPNEDELEAALIAAARSPEALIVRLSAMVGALQERIGQMRPDIEKICDAFKAERETTDRWRALADDVFTWIEASQPGGTKAQLNAQFGALDDLIARYRELRDQ